MPVPRLVASLGLCKPVAGALIAAAALGLAACDQPPTAIPPGPGQTAAPPIRNRPVDPPPPAPIELADAGSESQSGSSDETAASAEPTGQAGGPVASSGPGAGTGKGVRDGGACERGDQCASGVCEGEGCGPDRKGVCMSQNRSCTRDLRAFCGCDGQTFRASGSCPGRRFSARAAGQ